MNENYVLLKDLPYADAGTTVYYVKEKDKNRFQIKTKFHPVSKSFSIAEIINNPKWFMKESEYNKEQETIKEGLKLMSRTPIELVQNQELYTKYAEIERDIYKDIVFNIIDKEVNSDKTTCMQIKEENKALSFTIENLYEKLNRLEVPAQQRYENALTNFRYNKKLADIDYLEFRKILRIALGLDHNIQDDIDKENMIGIKVELTEGDVKLLEFIKDRLINFYHDKENDDFIMALQKTIKTIEKLIS